MHSIIFWHGKVHGLTGCMCGFNVELVYLHEHSKKHMKKAGLYIDVMQCTGCTSANTRLHQLRWGDQDMGIIVSCMHLVCMMLCRWLNLCDMLDIA